MQEALVPCLASHARDRIYQTKLTWTRKSKADGWAGSAAGELVVTTSSFLLGLFIVEDDVPLWVVAKYRPGHLRISDSRDRAHKLQSSDLGTYLTIVVHCSSSEARSLTGGCGVHARWSLGVCLIQARARLHALPSCNCCVWFAGPTGEPGSWEPKNLLSHGSRPAQMGERSWRARLGRSLHGRWVPLPSPPKPLSSLTALFYLLSNIRQRCSWPRRSTEPHPRRAEFTTCGGRCLCAARGGTNGGASARREEARAAELPYSCAALAAASMVELHAPARGSGGGRGGAPSRRPRWRAPDGRAREEEQQSWRKEEEQHHG
jgi:hypothetical protein